MSTGNLSGQLHGLSTWGRGESTVRVSVTVLADLARQAEAEERNAEGLEAAKNHWFNEVQRLREENRELRQTVREKNDALYGEY